MISLRFLYREELVLENGILFVLELVFELVIKFGAKILCPKSFPGRNQKLRDRPLCRPQNYNQEPVCTKKPDLEKAFN